MGSNPASLPSSISFEQNWACANIKQLTARPVVIAQQMTDWSLLTTEDSGSIPIVIINFLLST